MDSMTPRSDAPLPGNSRTQFLLWLDMADQFEQAIRSSPLSDRIEISSCSEADMPSDEALARAEVLVAWRLPPGMLARMPRLRWIQCQSAGVESWLARPDLDERVTLTGARGVHRLQMPDTILASLFYVTKPFETIRRQQQERTWRRLDPESLAGKTLGIIGLGAIGCELARKAAALDVRVVGVKRTVEPVPGVDRVYDLDHLDDALHESDHVVLLLPVTPATVDLIDTTRLAAMKPSAWLMNFGRGQLIVDADLVDAVRRGVVAGALLDAFRQEPLPPDHPFWTTENIIVYPHIGGRHARRSEFVVELFLENLARFMDNRPLRSAIDRARGY